MIFLFMDVQVTTTEANQRVKLDATVTTFVVAIQAETIMEYGLTYDLIRDPSVALTFTLQGGNYVRTPGATSNRFYNWHPNFTFVDVPGAAGNYTYRVSVTEDFIRVGVTAINAINLGVTATIFPPA